MADKLTFSGLGLTFAGFDLELDTGMSTVTIGDRVYPTVKIGNQVWLAENLDYKFTGCTIGASTKSSSIAQANYYNNDETTYGVNGNKYGLLYNGVAVDYMEANKSSLFPGWHVATRDDFDTLITYAGGTSVAGKKLKSTDGWNNQGWAGTDDYGFDGKPAGQGLPFAQVGAYCEFWTSTSTSNPAYKWYKQISGLYDGVYENNTALSAEFPVRLVKDAEQAVTPVEPEVQYCPNCNEPWDGSTCLGCGYPNVPTYETCPGCGENTYDGSYCSNCGYAAPVYETCPNCGENTYDGANCYNCGYQTMVYETCPNCGETAYYNGYCESCGYGDLPPDTGDQTCPNCGEPWDGVYCSNCDYPPHEEPPEEPPPEEEYYE